MQNTDYKEKKNELKAKLKKNLEAFQFTSIEIEVFWSELISISQRGITHTIIDPADIVYEMIKKGEPFQFLSGNSLKINEHFFETLKNKYRGLGKEKVLVLSVLGSQSSGKSNLLNQTFGCRFWTGDGGCTKGIYLSIMKIQIKECVNNNLFDYILILDSEGLQNPNQVDQELDKKIGLFVLAISDIIMINAKRYIDYQFKNLLEICIFTLSSLNTNLSSVKQLTWCFNQETDCRNLYPYSDQISQIAHNLTRDYTEGDEKNETINYDQLLNISKNNIQYWDFLLLKGYGGWMKFWIFLNFGLNQQLLKPSKQKLNFLGLSVNLKLIFEYSELKEYQQDQQMKKKFEQILQQEQQQLNQKEKIIQEKLHQFKENNYISKKIYLKYINLLNQFLQEKK